MKSIHYLMLFITVISFIQEVEAKSLIEAFRNREITLSIRSNQMDPTSYSSHSGRCVRMNVTNNTNAVEDIRIENGYHLKNSNTSHQDLIVARSEHVVLKPYEQKSIAVNALCCELHHAAPSLTDTFQLLFRHSGTILKLTQYFDILQTSTATAQLAMWCLTDGCKLDRIYDTHEYTCVENTLVRFLAKATHQSIPERIKRIPNKANSENQNHAGLERELKYPLEISGAITIYLNQPSSVCFYLTNESHQIIDTVLIDKFKRLEGYADYAWTFRTELYPGNYYLEMKRNEDWYLVKSIRVQKNRHNTY